MHSSVSQVVRAVAWHWKVPGSIPLQTWEFFIFEERTGQPVLRTDLKPKIFFAKNLVFSPQNEVFGYKHICTDMHRYKHICMDIALIHADIGGYIPDINRYAQIIRDIHIYAQI
jgi:hypothetical protein